MADVKVRPNPSALQRYGSAFLLTALATVVRILAMQALARYTYTPFIVAVILASLVWRAGAGVVATVLGALIGALLYARD